MPFLLFLFSLPSLAGGQLCEKALPSLAVMAKWSSDRQAQTVISRQNCPTDPAVTSLQKLYLKRLGIAAEDPDPLFRILVAGHAEVAALKPLKLTAEAVLAKAQWIGKVAVVGASARGVENLKALLAKLGPARERFWDEKALFKVAVTRQKKMAAFIPEWASLSLSSEILESPKLLHQFVLLHELTHVAEVKGATWEKEFAAFSGPGPVETLAAERKDQLTEDSNVSDFSVLPDPVLAPKGKDGYVLAKSYRETKKQKSFSEDLADSVAAFVLTPERFCWAGKALAPQKYEWVRKTLFPEAKELECERKTP